MIKWIEEHPKPFASINVFGFISDINHKEKIPEEREHRNGRFSLSAQCEKKKKKGESGIIWNGSLGEGSWPIWAEDWMNSLGTWVLGSAEWPIENLELCLNRCVLFFSFFFFFPWMVVFQCYLFQQMAASSICVYKLGAWWKVYRLGPAMPFLLFLLLYSVCCEGEETYWKLRP